MKILNLYAGIGGNRALWGSEHEVTAVEFDERIAKVYKDNFPQDEVVVGCAKEYLLKHFQEFDFIWASPPCPSHSRMRTLWKGDGKGIPGKIAGSSFKLPDMDLYSIILFLKHFFDGDWVVENVIPYYEPLIKPQVIDNHCFWSNKVLQDMKARQSRQIRNQDLDKGIAFGFDLSKYDLPARFKRKMINNCVMPVTGKKILDSFTKTKQVLLNELRSAIKGNDEKL